MRWPALLPLLIGLTPGLATARVSLEARVDARDAQAYHFDITLERATAARLSCSEVGNDRELHRIEAPAARSHLLTLRGLKASTQYRCGLEATRNTDPLPPPVSFITAPLPQGLVPPVISVPSANLAETGYTLYNYANTVRFRTYAFLVIVDAEGNVRWNYRLSDVGPGSGATGDMDATWMGGDRIAYGGDLSARVPPTVIGLDKKTYYAGTAEQMTPTDRSTSFSHDSGPSADGASFFYLNDTSITGIGSVPSGSTYTGFIVKQLDPGTNKVIWYWDSIEHGYQTGGLDDPGAWYSSQSQFPGDPYHANAVEDRWENGRLYVYIGMRHQNEIIKIDYLTKAVVWKLGLNRDFTLLEKDGSHPAGDFRWFFNLHDAHVVGNRVFMFDNGVDRNQYGGTSYSRMLELELDTTARTARIVYEYTEPGWLEMVFGGLDPLPTGNRLAALPHSSWGSSSALRGGMIELGASSGVLWRADFSTAAETLYRADHIDGCAIFNSVQYCPKLQ